MLLRSPACVPLATTCAAATLPPPLLQASAAGDIWRVQRRQLECLPDHISNELLRRLLEQRRITPPQLELFQHTATSVRLAGHRISASWLAHLNAFRCLHELRLQRCSKLRDAHLQCLAALSPTLQLLDLSGCLSLTDAAAAYLSGFSALRCMDLTATSIGDGIAGALPALSQLSSLVLGSLAVTDSVCEAAGFHLPHLHHLDLPGTAVTDAGMRHLEQLHKLENLDVSWTEAHSPPVITTLRHLNMGSCALGFSLHDTAQEAIWLHLGTALPMLKELQLAGTSLLAPHGEQLLQQLVAGAMGSLRQLDLSRSSCFSGNLAMLVAATSLTALDLSGTSVTDSWLSDIALLPLRRLNLSNTALGDPGIAQLLAMTTLECLNLSDTRVGDESWAVIEQLPSLAWLDLSGSRVSLDRLHVGAANTLSSLTALLCMDSHLTDKGCCNLAEALPKALLKLHFGSKKLSDRALKAICSLPKLRELELADCEGVSDHGLLRCVPRCVSLQRFVLRNCWLATSAGVQAAAAAAAQAGSCLVEVLHDGEALALPAPPTASTPRSPSVAGSRQGSRDIVPVSPLISAFDERVAYNMDELLQLGEAPRSQADMQLLRERLPAELRST